MNQNQPYVLSIAGFDPCGGAGVLADIKTFEQNKVYGFGVVTALTYQNDTEFESVDWIPLGKIILQIEVLLKKFDFRYIKIGLVENLETLKGIVDFLHKNINDPVIIFDPILKASAGFLFHQKIGNTWLEVLKRVSFLTPNIPEAEILFGSNDLQEKLLNFSVGNNTGVYLKGGHTNNYEVVDTVFHKGKQYICTKPRLEHGEKHGSGCVLSSAFLANLALGFNIETAAYNAFGYTYKFLSSNGTLLGNHNNINQ